ncbi:MAG: phosphoenolpyruvate hydrolase family protein [Spirochaetes bacterium]|nr:phosphoenolpyruvate hydrolase family protein [Spirochaetota bacterium]
MAVRFSRGEVLLRLRKKIDRGQAVIAAGAGTGISAKCEEKGGVDLIAVYNSGYFRMSGLPSVIGMLPYGDANSIVMNMGERLILPVVKDTPVIAGINGTDPTRDIGLFLKKIKDTGFSGVINFPTVAVFDGNFRRKIEFLGLSYAREMEMLKNAGDMDLFTMAYAFTPEEAAMAGRAGTDAIIAHMGTTIGGSVGVNEDLSMTIDNAVDRIQMIFRAVKDTGSRAILMIHGGPLSAVDDVARVFKRTDAAGFVGASSMERVPVEQAIERTARSFCSLKIGHI